MSNPSRPLEPGPTDVDRLTSDELSLVNANRKVQAIKMVYMRTSLSLIASKHLVEQHQPNVTAKPAR